MDIAKNDPRLLRAWCVYDWANSAHALVIVSAIFPVYYGSITKQLSATGIVSFFGLQLKSSVLFSYTIALSICLSIVLMPILSALADRWGRKRGFMRFFVGLGASATAGLYFFTADNLAWAVVLFGLSLVGYSGSLVFYNAYLPEIATEDHYDALSARGYSWGYVGSVVLMVICVVLIELSKLWALMSEAEAVRWGFLLTGLWWGGFAQYTLAYLPKGKRLPSASIGQSWGELALIRTVWREAAQQPYLRTFLLAFFCYISGVQTIMYVAAIFGEVELGIPGTNLLLTVLLIQIVAIVGARGMAWLSARWGNIRALLLGIGVWVGVAGAAYFVNEVGFYILAGIIGLLMGGSQALSRATYAKLMPTHTPYRSSYFAFYDILDKAAIVVGTFSFGFMEQLTGNIRNGILAIGVYFVVGGLLLVMIPSRHSYKVAA